MSMRQIYQRTLERHQRIQEAGFNLIFMWECEWKQIKLTQLEIQQYLENLQLIPRLEPWEAFFGGRTNAIQLYCKVEPSEKIR